jgi:hypothetical protein
MRDLYVLATLALFLCLLCWAGYTRGQGTNSRRQNWEYRVDPAPGTERSVTVATEFDKPVMEKNQFADERLINQRAAEGWELTAVGGFFYYFKRAK